MEILNLYGDITTACKAQIICHQVNCQGKMNSGVAKCVREKFPEVFEKYLNYVKTYGNRCLGTCQIVQTTKEEQLVANLFGQNNYGYDGKRYTSYDALYSALEELRDYCINAEISSIAFPNRIGCDRGGANWDIVQLMIVEVFKSLNDFTIYFYKFTE